MEVGEYTKECVKYFTLKHVGNMKILHNVQQLSILQNISSWAHFLLKSRKVMFQTCLKFKIQMAFLTL